MEGAEWYCSCEHCDKEIKTKDVCCCTDCGTCYCPKCAKDLFNKKQSACKDCC